MLVTSKHTVCVYRVMSPLLIDRNQNFFTLTTKKAKEMYKNVYTEILRENMLIIKKKKLKAITNQEGFSCHVEAQC